MIHIWTADVYESDKWSSQWISKLSNWNKEAWKKKFRASTGFEPVTSAIPVRCSTNWAIEATHRERGQLWVHIFPWEEWNDVMYMKWFIYELRMYMRVINDRRSLLLSYTSRRSRVRIPLKPWIFFRLLYSNCLNWKFTATIIYHSLYMSVGNICKTPSEHKKLVQFLMWWIF